MNTALVIILGLTNGAPAQVIHRDWPAQPSVSQERDAACAEAQAAARAALQGVLDRSAQFTVSITCRVERMS